ncbi:hypothetical protein CLV86_0563, partial [Lacinutrix venerupis]|uniref:Ig-like domain-containing protein n=1 Tax=Lacinutrix venerupis TaxID=1486034 RepID=UPI000F13080E
MFSQIGSAQNISPTDGAGARCGNCVPPGWLDNGGTPDISDRFNVAGTGAGLGENDAWDASPLPLPPNGHTTWLTLRDVGTLATEESVTTTITGLTVGNTYELHIYALTSTTASYSPEFIDFYQYQIQGEAEQNVSPINTVNWQTTVLRFIATAADRTIVLSPGANMGNNTANLESVNLSVSLNAINSVPVADDNSDISAINTPATFNVTNTDADADGNIDVATVDLDPTTSGIQNSLTTADGNWSVDNLGNVTFNPNSGFIGTTSIPYTVNDDYVLDGNNASATSNPASLTVNVLPDNDGDGIDDVTDLDDDNDGILDSIECNYSIGFTGPFNSSNTTFNFTGSGGNGPAELDAVVVNGNVITNFIVPDGYEENFVTTDANSIYEVTNDIDGNVGGVSGDNISNPNWNNLILDAFQDRNLNHFQKQDSAIQPSDYYTLTYNTPVLIAGDSFLFISERGGNNNTIIEAYDINNNYLGSQIVIVANSANYLTTSVTASNGQVIEIAPYSLSDLGPVGSYISSLRIISNSTGDAADGKVFIYTDPFACEDTDGDGLPDSLDTDSDGDGCFDALEGGDNIEAVNVLPNGQLDGAVDLTTGVPNNVDVNNGQTAGTSIDNTQFDSFGQCDSDGDGVIDANDICNGFDDTADIDGDGVPNGCDLDNDNDGILDVNECSPSKTVDILIQATDLTYTASGNPGNIGDTARYANVGSYEGTAIDLRITVLGNSDPANLEVDLSGVSFDPANGEPIIYYPIYLASTDPAITGFANFDFEFLINGTNNLIEVPANMVFQDIDDTTPGELVEFNKVDILDYEVTTTTSLVVASSVTTSSFGSAGSFLRVTSTGNSAGAADENLWFGIQMPFVDQFDITFAKRQFDTGYLFNTQSFVNPTTTTQVTPACTADYDNDGIPDYLDVDSDNDGCFDALEGDENIPATEVLANGQLNGSVDANGVPNNVANQANGQGAGSSTDETVIVCNPDAEDDTATTEEDTPVDIDVLDNDDLGTEPTTITAVTTPANGTATINDNGTPADPSDDYVVYTPNADFDGPTDTFDYTITDANGNESTATVTVTVTPTPDAEDDTATTEEDTPVDIDVLDNDDLGTEPTTITAVTTPANGTATINDNG